jgi:hypothetical protein
MTTRTAPPKKWFKFYPTDYFDHASEPAKRWRNKYRALAYVCLASGKMYRPGEVLDAENTWPTRDVAETVALDDVKTLRTDNGSPVLEHLGAFPVEAS